MGLPDPTADLDWSGYIGAIHEIFHKNALKHPDAPCVTETASSTTPERRYTYKQIYEASNILANQLHEAGITNGDVVMIFAYRSVELIIAFMGTLAAGATITVLDPAYPPARQQIYLEVSQPKALITIGRARDENGTFAPRVQKYIDEELSLKIRVPELRVSDDGHLTGGEVDGKEVFTDAENKASAPPDVLVGPDSTSILSFTSGTTSTPKYEIQQLLKAQTFTDYFQGRVGQTLQLSQVLSMDGQDFQLDFGDEVCLSKVNPTEDDARHKLC